MKLNKLNFYEILIIPLIFIIVNLMSSLFQSQVTYNEGKGWDGVDYYKVAEDIKSHKKIEAKAPFVYRIGTSLIVAKLFPNDLMTGFKIINIAASALIVVLLLLFLALFINSAILRILFVSMFIGNWLSPVRMIYYAPVDSDPLSLAIILALTIFILINKDSINLFKIILLSILTFLSVFVREICIIPAIVLLFLNNPLFIDKDKFYRICIKKIDFTRIIPLLSGLIALIVLQLIATKTNDYNYISTAMKWAYKKSLIMYVHSWFIAFGPIIVILIYDWKLVKGYLAENQHLMIFMVLYVLLSFIGGTDTERLIYWSMPVTFLLIGKCIEKNPDLYKYPFFWGIIAAVTAISQRYFWILPDFPNNYPSVKPLFTPMTNKFQLLDLWTMHGESWINGISSAEYFFIAIILIYLLWKRMAKIKTLEEIENI